MHLCSVLCSVQFSYKCEYIAYRTGGRNDVDEAREEGGQRGHTVQPSGQQNGLWFAAFRRRIGS